jgi:outer membrane biosynthesis protein TonB
MKDFDLALKVVAEGLRTIAQGIGKIAEKLEESAPKKQPKAKRKPASKTKTKPAPKAKVVAKPKKAPAKKAPAKKTVKTATAADTVLAIINRSKKGVNSATLSDKTGFDKKKIANIVFKLRKMGKIKSVNKGVYAKV